MPKLPKLARLQLLTRSLETAARTIHELAATKTMERLATQEPERWNFVVDSLAAAMEPGEMGTVCQVLTALTAALED